MIPLGVIAQQKESGPPPSGEWVMNLNFSEVGQTDDNAPGWNQARFVVDGSGQVDSVTSQVFSNLKDENDNDIDVTFQVTFCHDFPGISNAGVSESFPVPQVYVRDFYVSGVSAGSSAMTWKLSGLDPAGKYDLRCIPYIDSGVNAELSVDGGITWSPDASAYPTTGSFDDPNYISIDDISPNGAGEIIVDVASGSVGDWLSVLAIRLRKQGSAPEPPEESLRSLSIQFDGLPEDVDVLYNGELQPDGAMMFPSGTTVENITPDATGYTFSPPSQTVIMDSNKTISFTATPV